MLERRWNPPPHLTSPPPGAERDRQMLLSRARLTPHGAGVVEIVDPSAAIEDLRRALGEALMQRQHIVLHVARRTRLQLEMTIAVGSAHQRRAVRAFKLIDRGRDVADRKADPPVRRRVRWRTV